MDKNLLKGTKAYLAGPVEKSPDSGASWRDTIKDHLQHLEITVWNPLIKPKWHIHECGGELTATIQKFDLEELYDNGSINKNTTAYIRNQLTRQACLRLASAADFIICYIDGPTVGTMEELCLAQSQGKPILFIHDGLDSCWRAVQFPDSKYFKSIRGLVNYLSSISTGALSVDNKQWIFLPGAWPDAS